MSLSIEFAGEVFRPVREVFHIGREGDLAIDDNPYLHRRFLELRHDGSLWWLVNVGSQLTAALSDETSGMHAQLAPSGRMPIVFPTTNIRFSAGPTTYELRVAVDDAPYVPPSGEFEARGDTTIGQPRFTADQRLLIVALAEPALLDRSRGAWTLPTSAQAARRLGWELTRFNRKLDNVCDKLQRHGVRGLHGETGNVAAGRRARLVDHAISAGLVTSDDLRLLPEAVGQAGS